MFPIKSMPELNNSEMRAPESRPQSASQKFISFAFGKIVALWPADSRDWALAMQAELPQMESTQESLQWLAGGIMSLGKAWWNGALSSDNKKDLAPVKRPGILAALVTVAALAILLIPSANQGLRAVLTSWRPNLYEAQQAQFLQMAREAESRGDARTMAFAAMRLASQKDFTGFANKAVALDRSLTWIFTQGYFERSLPETHDWPAKLEAWDPGNGVAYLIQAEIRKAQLVQEGQIPWDAPKDDPEWMECGRKAMESPRYDSYRYRRLQLDREVILSRDLNAVAVIAIGPFRSGWVNTWPIQVYSKKVLDEANAAVARRDFQTAKRDAWAVAHFGELLRAQGGVEVERLTGVGYLRPSYTLLQPILAAEGKNDEAAMLAHELQAIRPGAPAAVYNGWPDSSYMWLRTASGMMNLGSAGAALFSVSLLFSGLWLFAARFAENLRSGALYRTACRGARYAPAGLLASVAIIAASYWPTSDAVNTYLTRPVTDATLRNLSNTFYSVYYVPNVLFRSGPNAQYHLTFWMVLTVFGVLTIATIIARNILNRTIRPEAA